MIDLYLRAADAATLAAACSFLHEDGQWLESGDGFAFDPIGPVATKPGTYDDDGTELTPPVIDHRFHANLRCTDEVAALVPESMLVHPGHPARVWA